MVIIELRFVGGRFHATPWGRHVNEGVPEWPPSPFRLVRALFDTWQRKAADVPPDRIEALLQVLARETPDFSLPRAGASHTRSFLRQGSTNEADKALVFDPFVVVMPNDPIRIGWPTLVLPQEQTKLLETLVTRMNYFGRAESLAHLRLGDDSSTISWNCRPVDRFGAVVSGSFDVHEIVQVACVAAPDTHVRLEAKREKGKKARLEWFDAITWGSAEVLDQKLSEPPALRWVNYRRSREALGLPPIPRVRSERRRVDMVLFALHGRVLPLVTDTIAVAESFRICAMGASRRIGGGDPTKVSSLLSGKDATGAPLKDHQHAYYLPLDSDGDGRVDHVLVRCGAGLGSEEQLALAGVRTLWQSHGRPDVQLVSVAAGMTNDLLQRGRLWTSTTPFVTLRHHKATRGTFDAWLETELRRALQQEGMPNPSSVQRVPDLCLDRSGRTTRWLEFQRARKNDNARLGYGFRVEFPTDVTGPFAVGYGSHFGLGAFRKV